MIKEGGTPFVFVPFTEYMTGWFFPCFLILYTFAHTYFNLIYVWVTYPCVPQIREDKIFLQPTDVTEEDDGESPLLGLRT